MGVSLVWGGGGHSLVVCGLLIALAPLVGGERALEVAEAPRALVR